MAERQTEQLASPVGRFACVSPKNKNKPFEGLVFVASPPLRALRLITSQ